MSGVDWMRASATIAIPAIFGAVIWGAQGALIGSGLGLGIVVLGVALGAQLGALQG